ncbi:hypothetical protein TNCV_4346801 [Trichonephila clavipes]|nr:hypothetical protein TNCV_4346801 [Trichonephila clavipes]
MKSGRFKTICCQKSDNTSLFLDRQNLQFELHHVLPRTATSIEWSFYKNLCPMLSMLRSTPGTLFTSPDVSLRSPIGVQGNMSTITSRMASNAPLNNMPPPP